MTRVEPGTEPTPTSPGGRRDFCLTDVHGTAAKQTLEGLLRARADLAAERGRFVAVFEQVCQALAYAHAHGVIHRDLKPANVMVGAFGEVQVMDWGLAKVLGERPAAADAGETTAETRVVSLRDSDGSFTHAGSVLGTPAFMPPEQAAGAVGKVDRRSDVFGLGAVLAVILTGQAPFAGGSAETVRVQSAQGKLEECFARLDGCGADPELVALCRRCLAPTPADRPADAGEVARAVAALRAAADERARRAELERVRAEAEARAQRQKRRAQLAVAAGLLALVLVGGGAWLVVRGQAARRADADASASVALGRAEQLASQAAALDPGTPAEAKAAAGVWEEAESAVAQAEAPAAACSAAVAARISEKARGSVTVWPGRGATPPCCKRWRPCGRFPPSRRAGITTRPTRCGRSAPH